MLEIAGSTLWPKIELLASNARRKQAAVAFVTDDLCVKFGKGDLLIVDASDQRIAAGDTSKKVICDAVKRRASVYSLANLHAKLFLFDDTLVIGSSNISRSSQHRLHEVGLVTDNTALVKQAVRSLEELRTQAQKIDRRFLDRIRAIPVRPRIWNGSATDGKPSLLEFLRSGSPLLADYAIIVYCAGATLKAREIRKRARSTGKRLPPPKKWSWFEDPAEPRIVSSYRRFFESKELKAIGLEVDLDTNGAIAKVIDVDRDTYVFVNMMKIKRRIAGNFIRVRRAPFVCKKTELLRVLNEKLKERPNAGKIICSKPGWMLRAAEFVDLLRI